MSALSDVRPSPIAGRWYENNPTRLARQIDTYLDYAVIPPLPGEVIGLVAPHAGHRYSGLTAAHAFKTVQGNSYDLVVVIAPYHDLYPGSLITTAHQAYGTPLGPIPVHGECLSHLEMALKTSGGLTLNRLFRDTEHSLEIELPFLQRSLIGKFSLLPVMVRSRDAMEMRTLGETIADVTKDLKTLLVASSDLSHFFPESQALLLDGFLEKQVEKLSPEGVLNADITGKGYACGAGAISAVMWASLKRQANKAIILHHSTSADETGDRSSVVGYASAVFVKTE
ncbi:MAG: AmmeMemoRadiSam system protein B [Leptolinea sp.]|nr:AmmeMemoRadiSam system protein B [Leptolinea sp.]